MGKTFYFVEFILKSDNLDQQKTEADCFVSFTAIPVEAVKQNPNLAMLITCHGGHIGFLEGLWPRQSTYMDRVFKQFAKAVIEQGSRLKDLS